MRHITITWNNSSRVSAMVTLQEFKPSAKARPGNHGCHDALPQRLRAACRLAPAAAWNQVPVIMLTSRGREEDVVQGLNSGASDYLIKPFRPSELMARIGKLLRPAPKAGQ